MNPYQPYILVGIIVNSALYLGAVFVAALVAHNLRAEYLAIAAMGATYVSYFLQMLIGSHRQISLASVGGSIALGISAGVSLL